jgi:hypothetical protein
MRSLATAIVVVITMAMPAAAEPSAADAAAARTLFDEGRKLMKAGNYAEACPKLEESQRLDPAVGTQFNLADCYEHLGRTATAYALFKEVAAIARAAGKFERENSAKDRAATLEPKLARVRLAIAAKAPGLEVKIDDAAIDRARWAEAFPIDPGAHRLVASAPRHETFETRFDAKEASRADVRIPELVDLQPRRAFVVEKAEPTRNPSVLTYVAGGIGVAALATGTVAVLAGGIDLVYPPENEGLQAKIGACGCLITEMPFGVVPRAKDFPRRNRIISGIALGVLIVEAARRSGTLVTARFAAEQGRDVFAVPGHPLDPRAEGTNKLLKSGATLVTEPDDLLSALAPLTGRPVDHLRETEAVSFASPTPAPLSDHDRDRVVAARGPAPVDVDSLARGTGLSIRAVQTALIELALAGRIERYGNGLVSLISG